jgi:predicted SprT family Zn-dependent metalloprotease
LNHGDRAHLVALEEMMGKPHQEKDWRTILDLIDELTKGEEK